MQVGNSQRMRNRRLLDVEALDDESHQCAHPLEIDTGSHSNSQQACIFQPANLSDDAETNDNLVFGSGSPVKINAS